jgi:DNA-directed RNA polymerase specialized sigma subunit
VRRRRRRGTGRQYFTKEHEDAIVAYCKTDDVKERTRLYKQWIQPVFNELVDKIVFTYKFTSLPNIDDLKGECKVWLTTVLNKFDQSKGSKAFSYFSVITKNWFIHKVKKNARQLQREVYIEDISKEADFKTLSTSNKYHTDREEAEFWSFLWAEIETWENTGQKTNDEKVLQAVKILLSNPDDIPIFNKKAIYLYLRELTGLNTKQVVNSLNKMRIKYKTFKTKWDSGET